MAKALEELNKALGPAGDNGQSVARSIGTMSPATPLAYRARTVDIRADWFTPLIHWPVLLRPLGG
jgi:hypothetical protein